MNKGLWTDDEVRQLMEMKARGASFSEIASVLDRPYDTCRKKHGILAAKLGHEAIRKAAEAPPIDIDYQATIRKLEADNALLRQQLTWAQHADSPDRTGGVLTLRASDHHFGDANHLLSCCRSLETKAIEVIRQYQPERIQIVAGDDWIAGRGIYREQDLDMITSDATQQCQLGAMKARDFLLRIREVSPAPIQWSVMRGNHDYANGVSLTEYLHLLMKELASDIAEVEFKMHWDYARINLASEGYYNVLIRHGFGHSKISPMSPSFISSMKDQIILDHRELPPKEQYRRVIAGHTHWLCVGVEHIVGLFFDNTGGLQRNTRIKIGDNQRPTGWIVYVSPKGLTDDILQPIALVPDEDTYRREIADPNLVQSNRQDAAETLKAFRALMEQFGSYAPGNELGKVKEGRW